MSKFQMPARLVRCAAPIQMFARRLFGDKSGVAAIEFGFIAPLMFMMLVGTVELAQLITVDRRVTVVASTTADLVAREQNINKAGIDVVMQIVGVLFAPYETAPLKVELIAVGALETALANTKTCWSYGHQLGGTPAHVRNTAYPHCQQPAEPRCCRYGCCGGSVLYLHAADLFVVCPRRVPIIG
jgi:Flp pilus assembly protein TadG